jgi:hypothetical protein
MVTGTVDRNNSSEQRQPPVPGQGRARAVRQDDRVQVRPLLPPEAPADEAATATAAPAATALAPGKQARSRRRWLVWGAALTLPLALAAAVGLTMAAPWRDRVFDRAAAPIKGGSRFGFYIKRGGAVWQGRPGELVAPGDSLRFVFWPRRVTHAAVFSRDGGGHVSVYFPAAAQARRLAPGHEIVAPGAVVLDASVGSETLFAVFCEAPFAVDPLRASISAGGLWSPPRGCEFETLTIEKRT